MTTDTVTEAPAPHRPGYRFYVLAVLILIYMLNFLDRQIIGILAAPLKEEFGTVSYTHLTLPTKRIV